MNDPGQPWVRQRGRPLAGLVDEVDVQVLDRRHVLREPVEPRFLRSPVEAIAPIVRKAPDEGEASAVIPPLSIEGRRQAGHP
jgi:hypothetical protein